MLTKTNLFRRLLAILTLVVLFCASTPAGAAASETDYPFGKIHTPWGDFPAPKYHPGLRDFRLGEVSERIAVPPSEAVRWTAEWERREGVLLTWPLYLPAIDDLYCGMVDELQDVGTVFLLHDNEQERLTMTLKLQACGVALYNIEWLRLPYVTNWIRDYGPQNVWGLESGKWGIVDFYYYGYDLDDSMNARLHLRWRMEFSHSFLATEGGNMYTDGMGRMFATDWILQENRNLSEARIRRILHDYLGVQELIILPQPPISIHLDMTAKLVDPETWIVGQWPPDDPNTPAAEEIVAVLENMTASTGNPYTVYRVQQPGPQYGPDRDRWRSYTNAYMQNGTVLVPTYGVQQDAAALRVYREVLPDWEIVGLDSTGFDGMGGAIHCSTHGIASREQIDLLLARFGAQAE